MVARYLFGSVTLLSAAPAWATAGTSAPMVSNVTLFAIGIAGVLIGRRASRKRD